MDQDMEEENEENERENKRDSDYVHLMTASCCFSRIKSTFRTFCALQIAEYV